MTAHAASCTHALRIHLAVEFDYLPAPGRSDTLADAFICLIAIAC